MLEVGDALVLAHQSGIIHRDVKPANILLDNHHRAKLTDFDLARGTVDTQGTRTGALGTFIYAAPEELENAKQVDQRADVYSLGMTALFVLYGKDLPTRAFQNGGWFINQLQYPDELKRVLAKAVAWEHQDRYATVREFCVELTQALAKGVARTDCRTQTDGMQRQRHRRTILGAVVACGMIGPLLWRVAKPPHEVPPISSSTAGTAVQPSELLTLSPEIRAKTLTSSSSWIK